jgi:hypothetical protein
MRRMLSLIVGSAVVIAFSLATPADAQRSKRSQTTNSGVAKQQQQAPNDARSSYGQATSGSANGTSQQSGQCYVATDVNNLGYWGECSTKGARQVK